ncbi:unnamed protein product [Acanthoscelides obtectus]|uniref:Zinc finger protein 865 n=1 Tax=Acanthoscelides obtectus TaxID=200917 RepID=A0A9P0L0D3_ACAOB|nr:unnamed protein product [Acanthoscelides obtectus]CAK1651141.1 Zinc finger protein 26 [Acanthoscelides obtectus]
MSDSLCDVCNEIRQELSEACTAHNASLNYLLKLKSIVPEVGWLPGTNICDICINELETAYKFKQTCLKSASLQKIATQNVNSSELDGDPFNYNRSVSNPFECSDCNIDFDTQEQLLSHQNENHTDDDNCSRHLEKYKRNQECLKCGRKFALTSSLDKHELFCDGIIRHSKVYDKHQCEKCNRFYTTQKILLAHKKKCKQETLKKTKYQCVKCHAYYISLKTLRHHERRGCKADLNKMIKEEICDICSKQFASAFLLKKHIAEDHMMCKCEECGVSFGNYEEFIAHVKSEHVKNNSRRFTCEVCAEPFTLLKSLLQHCVQVHSMNIKNVKPYYCDMCNHRFTSSSNLLNHKLYHDGNRPNMCHFCGKSFITKNDLTIHEKTHYDERCFKCNDCDKTFKTNANLRTHYLVAHTDPSLWKYVCYACGKRFPQKSNHDQHVRRHTGEKNFACSLCIKSFTSKSELLEHVRCHSNERAHQCALCGKTYRKRYSYNIHLKKVHGIGNAKIRVKEKKYACHICAGKFHDKQKLARHLCTHSGIKPFGCAICDKRFSDRSYLNLHTRLNHNSQTTAGPESPSSSSLQTMSIV